MTRGQYQDLVTITSATSGSSSMPRFLVELETKVHPKVRNHGEGPN